MFDEISSLPSNKRIYFASDFHLGAPNYEKSREREDKIVRWLKEIEKDAEAVFLVGDLFDFWFEYGTVVPKGYIRFLGQLAKMADNGIKLYLFTGNHDMWMFDYLPKEIGAKIIRKPIAFYCNDKKFMIGHGDGLGPGDRKYKFLKNFFDSKVCQWLFARLHPNLGIGIANTWSKSSRASNSSHDEVFLGDDEWIYIHCKNIEEKNHHDYYIFGHRHLPLDLKVGKNSRYINLGEWIKQCQYAYFDGKDVIIEHFE
ncbi:UDP-2,3-diacylglucosamine diphosphatase [Aureibacter tunicatorum]|uniref:UDP-2,3-diacylglucosamine hydrolase n=1 Tax=Aureibacter tunicatorum TaxID=866807 RepID=A0AAE3XJ19_9BACT|nr:UDP-2,3-diacylglucosamine diphosphatase [Aureibacter tunicatorum]MDR6237767.1 UDP-2,3-diacylglucosamine hydrolase [Aureibacter tunicatorum]BDD02802.1 UDP-2,3-diacylglucosamine hydrolase [Aureibacter tunicatorum]